MKRTPYLKNYTLSLGAAMGMMAAVLTAQLAFADTNTWNVPGPAYWSTNSNWSPPGPISGTSDIVFTNIGDNGTPGQNGTANNIVDTNLAIQSLTYRNTNSYHTTSIGAGLTLTVGSASVTPGYATPGLMVGNILSVDEGNNPSNYTTILGSGALIVTNNQLINIRKGTVTSGGTHRATLDLTGLNTFNAYISQLLLAGDGTGTPYTGANRPIGWLWLARTNLIVATGGSYPQPGSPGILLSDSQSNAGSSDLWLGQTNAIFADSVTFGARKSSCYVGFNTNASLSPPLVNPIVVFRNSAGTGPMTLLSIGDRALDTGSTTSSGTALVELAAGGGSVDAQVSTMYVGRGQSSQTGAGGASSPGTGVLTYTNGSITAGVLELGYQWVGNAAAAGTINVGGSGQLIVTGGAPSSYLRLGNFISASAPPSGVPHGVLNIGGLAAGGSVWVNGPVIDGGGIGSAITNIGGSLKVSGTLGNPAASTPNAQPLQFMTLNNATLTFDLGDTPNPTTPWWQVTTLTVTAPVTVNVLGTSLTPGKFTLLKYATIIGDDGSAFTNSVPSLPPHVNGYLTNNISNSSIDMVITSVSTPKWNGTVAGGNWDINSTANWLPVSGGGGAITYLQYSVPGDPVLFDDSASGTTTVNLTTTLSPNGVTVNNSSKDYTFSGSGALSGPTGLTKSGSRTLTIANTGTNTFAGIVTINGGTVVLSGSANLLPTNAAVTLANDPTALLNLNNTNQMLGSLSGGGTGGNVTLGTGTLTINGDGGNYSGVISGSGKVVKSGSGTQVLTGANLYSGGTVVSGGTLAVGNTSGSGTGSGSVTVQSGGNFQFGVGPSAPGGSVSTSTITNYGTVTLNRSDDFVLTTHITGPGGLIQSLQTQPEIAAIDTPNTYSGGTIINYGQLRVSNQGALGTGPVFISSYYANLAQSCLALTNSITLTNALTLSQKGGNNITAGLDNVDGTNTLAGPLTLVGGYNGGGTWNINSDAGDLIIRSPVTFAAGGYSISGLRPFLLQGNGNGDLYSAINDYPAAGEVSGLLLNSSGTWTIWSTNGYTGGTFITNGTMIVNGALTGTANVRVGTDIVGGPNAVLTGTGLIAGPVTITASSYLCGNSVMIYGSPSGAPAGRLTINNALTLRGASTTVMGVSHSGCDQVAGLSSASFAGLLQVVITGPILGGETFKLFDSTTYSGTDFDSYALQDLGTTMLSWDTSFMHIDGTLRVSGTTVPQIESASVASDNNILLSGIGPTNWTYSILASTNVSLPLSAWVQVGSGTFTAGTFTFHDLHSTNYVHRFYDVVTQTQ